MGEEIPRRSVGGESFNKIMKNWSTDENNLKKDPEKYAIWRLEQLVNFGLGTEKLNAKELKKYWSEIVIDPARRKFLELLLYGKK